MDVQLAPGPAAPRHAREAVAPLRDELDARTHDDLRLIVSELVTNAVAHGPNHPIRVRVEVGDDGVVRGEIEDEGSGTTVGLRAARSGTAGGYGLGIVDALSDSWGVRGTSTRVWFELTNQA